MLIKEDIVHLGVNDDKLKGFVIIECGERSDKVIYSFDIRNVNCAKCIVFYSLFVSQSGISDRVERPW